MTPIKVKVVLLCQKKSRKSWSHFEKTGGTSGWLSLILSPDLAEDPTDGSSFNRNGLFGVMSDAVDVTIGCQSDWEAYFTR